MDSGKVLFFLGLLNAEIEGHEEELKDLFKRALDENDDISRLNTSIDNNMFCGEIGKAMHSKAEELKDKVYSDPSKALEMLPLIRQAEESIGRALKDSEELLYSPLPFLEEITVLKNRDTMAYMNALKMIANCSVYLIMLYAGYDFVKEITWADAVGLREMIYAVNTKVLPVLCTVRRPERYWVIRRKKIGGKALFGGDCFLLKYETESDVKALCMSLHKEPIGTHSYLNIKAYETAECDVPLCWGLGNIISTAPDNATSFLQKKIVTKLRSPNKDELKRKVPTPFECARQLSDGVPFCISPDNLLVAMNQWLIGSEIEKRKKAHKCLFCGKEINENRLVCSNHFSSEFR